MATQLPLLLRRAFALDLRSLAVFRIGLGILVAADALLRSRDVGLMFAPDGMFPLAILREYFADPCAWSLATLVNAAWWGPAMLLLEATAGLLLAVGCQTRLATIVAWVAVVSVLRRAAPATNAGDALLTCLLFWGMFLPLAAAWSWDGRQGSRRGRTCSAATVAVMLQIAVVYLAAGLSKWNELWLSGDALRFVMSVHDHGTPLGAWLLGSGWLTRPLSWCLVTLEILGPLALIALPQPWIRSCLIAAFMLFHLTTCLTMTVGLFGYVGLVAWLGLLPTEAWDWLANHGWPVGGDRVVPDKLRPAGHWICVAAGLIALISRLRQSGRRGAFPRSRTTVGTNYFGCCPGPASGSSRPPLPQPWPRIGTLALRPIAAC